MIVIATFQDVGWPFWSIVDRSAAPKSGCDKRRCHEPELQAPVRDTGGTGCHPAYRSAMDLPPRLRRLPFLSPAADAVLMIRIERMVRKEALVSGKVKIVAYQSLPRTERKAKRVFDHRV